MSWGVLAVLECGWRRGAEVVSILTPDGERRAASGEEREEPICRIARSGGLRLYLLVIRVVPQPYSVSLHIPYSISSSIMTFLLLHTFIPTYVPTYLGPITSVLLEDSLDGISPAKSTR